MDIGKKIRELRTANDLTLEELASRSELTKGFLSQVERNLTSPSISTLEDILEALGTDLSQFFQPEKQQKIVFHTSDFFEDDQEDFKIEWIVPNAQKNDMEPILLTLHPGAKSMEMVSHSGEECPQGDDHASDRQPESSGEGKRDILYRRDQESLSDESGDCRCADLVDHDAADVLRGG